MKKARILAVEASGGDWRTLATSLGVTQPTAYRWVKQGEKPDERGRKRHFKVNEEHKNFMVEQIEVNPKITLQGIVEALNRRFAINLSKQTVSRHLDNLMYSLKSVRIEPEAANSAVNKEKRKVFAEALLSAQSQNLPILFMDESNFNLHITRS